MSAQALSDKCTEVGFPIPRNTIANLENGRKESVPIHEVTVLAMALGVAPIDLLLPVAIHTQSAVLPNDDRSAVAAGNWIVRQSEFAIYANHQELVQTVQQFISAEPALAEDGDAERERRLFEYEFRAVLSELAGVETALHKKGLPVPEMPTNVVEALDGWTKQGDEFRWQAE